MTRSREYIRRLKARVERDSMPPVEGARIVLTNDTRMRAERTGTLTETDYKVLHPEPSGLIEVTGDELVRMAANAQRAHAEFIRLAELLMNRERAQEIRLWRVIDGHSWRKVASLTWAAWGPDKATWSPSDNQLAGMALCQVAARELGQVHEAAPWN